MVNKAQKVHIRVAVRDEREGDVLHIVFETACGLDLYSYDVSVTDNLEEATCKHCLQKWRDRGVSETITVLKLGEYKK